MINKISSLSSDKKKLSSGFSLVEVLVVISIISVILGIAVFSFRSFQVKSDIDISQANIVHQLRRAITLARASEGDSDWGVYIQSESATIFKGNSYTGRDSSFDEVQELKKKVVPQQNYEIIFTKFSSEPQYVGNIVLNSQDNTKTININIKGVISY